MDSRSQGSNMARWWAIFILSIALGLLTAGCSPGIASSPSISPSEMKDARSLIEYLNDTDAVVRLQAAEALSSLMDSADDAEGIDVGSKNYIEWSIASSDSVGTLVAALQDSDPDVRSLVAEALGNLKEWASYDFTSELEGALGPQEVDLLSAALQDANPTVRVQAAWLLGWTREASAIAPLASALRDEDPDVRLEAVQALGNTYLDSAVDPLISALGDEDPNVRSRAAEMLTWGDASGALIGALEDEDPNVRFQAAESLLAHWDSPDINKRGIDTLAALLKDEDPNVRVQALEVLGQEYEERVVMPVVEVLNDKEPNVRAKAAEVLRNYYTGYFASAFYALEAEDPNQYEQKVDGLISVLQDQDPDIRSVAALVLGNTLSPRAVDPLLAMLNNGDPTDWLSAVRALGYTKDHRGVKPLVAALMDEDPLHQAEAALSLTRLGDAGVEALLATFDRQSLDAAAADYSRIIAEGQDSSLPMLVAALMRGGDVITAEAYMNCGQEVLAGAAGVWADVYGVNFMMTYGTGSGPSWGGR
jgi:HEAT repeat protein